MAEKNNDKTKQSDSKQLSSSGETTFSMEGGRQTVKVPKEGVTPLAPGSLLQTFYARMTPDSAPGWNTLTITGLPANTRVISVWMTEWSAGNTSHAGGAWFTTSSVQLFAGGTRCRVRFHQSWNTHLPAGCMVIYGPG